MSLYEYAATLVRVVDGDTIWVDLDLGLDIHHSIDLRLAGINAPEHNTAAGQAAKGHLIELLNRAGPMIIATQKDKQEKYGRYLAVVTMGGVNINDAMVADGHAVAYAGGKR